MNHLCPMTIIECNFHHEEFRHIVQNFVDSLLNHVILFFLELKWMCLNVWFTLRATSHVDLFESHVLTHCNS